MRNNPVLIGLLAYLLLGLSLFSLRPSSQPDSNVIPVSATLSGEDTQGYERAYAPRPFMFPADHGPHPIFVPNGGMPPVISPMRKGGASAIS
ncbi:MAG: hypothetical protein R3F37_18465 [Candidatus Competibacteraceae bacterium]